MIHEDFESIDLQQMPVGPRHQLLLSVVAPRPIALVGSVDSQGRANLSPFSFFNCFGANPPVIAVSPAYSGRTGEPKHSHLNILETKEFTVSIVNYDCVEMINLASGEYPRGVDEFEKAGFTKLKSQKIKAPGVANSPSVLECRLMSHVELGGKPGSGNLMIAEVVHMSLSRSVRGVDGKVDPRKLDLVSRMGGDWYSRAKEGLFELAKPAFSGVGVDALPTWVRSSEVLTGKHLSRLGSVKELPAFGQLVLTAEDEASFTALKSHEKGFASGLEQQLAGFCENGEIGRAFSWIARANREKDLRE